MPIKTAGAPMPPAAKEADIAATASGDNASAIADQKAAGVMATTDSEQKAFPIIKGTGNPYAPSSKRIQTR